MNNILFDIFLYIVEMLITYSYISRNYKRKIRNQLAIVLIGTVVFTICSFSYILLDNNTYVNLIVFLFGNIIFIKLCFQANIVYCTIHSIVLTLIMFASEILTLYIIVSLMGIPSDLYQDDFTMLIIFTVVSKIVYLIIAQLVASIISKNNMDNYSRKYLPLFAYPVLSIAILLLLFKLSIIFTFPKSYNIAVVVITVPMILFSVFVFIYFQRLNEKDRQLSELQAEQQRHELDTTYLELLEYQNEGQKMFIHDTKTHFDAIKNMDSIESIDRYITSIHSDIEKHSLIKKTNNKTIDLILSKYATLSQKNNIRFFTETKTANLIYLDDMDISIILNNVLDNAFEAAVKSTERVIEFSLKNVNDFDVLSVINSCDRSPLEKNKILLTTKSDKNIHGFGTKIIKKYVKKNNGNSEWYYDEDERRFHLTILFAKKT